MRRACRQPQTAPAHARTCRSTRPTPVQSTLSGKKWQVAHRLPPARRRRQGRGCRRRAVRRAERCRARGRRRPSWPPQRRPTVRLVSHRAVLASWGRTRLPRPRSRQHKQRKQRTLSKCKRGVRGCQSPFLPMMVFSSTCLTIVLIAGTSPRRLAWPCQMIVPLRSTTNTCGSAQQLCLLM